MLGYSGNTIRNSFQEYGASTKQSYLEKVNYALGYKQSVLKQNGLQNYRQHQFFTEANLFNYADHPGARIGWHLNYWKLTTASKTLANIYSGGWSFLNYSKTFYSDIFITQSNYADSQNHNKTNPLLQGKFSVEFWPGIYSSWLSLQVFTIQDAHSVLLGDTLYSTNLEWTQSFKRIGLPVPTRVILGAQLGEQRYLVDQRLNVINNSQDSQIGGYWISAIWQLKDSVESGLSIASLQYKTDAEENYEGIFVSINLKFKW